MLLNNTLLIKYYNYGLSPNNPNPNYNRAVPDRDLKWSSLLITDTYQE